MIGDRRAVTFDAGFIETLSEEIGIDLIEAHRARREHQAAEEQARREAARIRGAEAREARIRANRERAIADELGRRLIALLDGEPIRSPEDLTCPRCGAVYHADLQALAEAADSLTDPRSCGLDYAPYRRWKMAPVRSIVAPCPGCGEVHHLVLVALPSTAELPSR